MASAKKIESVSANIHQALNSLMERYERAPRHRGEKHKIYRSILLLQEELARLEMNSHNADLTTH